jgi:hypothetical protein
MKFAWLSWGIFFCVMCASAWRVNAQETPALYRIVVKGKFGFIDKTGWVVIEPQFSSAESFRNGLAQVMVTMRFSG